LWIIKRKNNHPKCLTLDSTHPLIGMGRSEELNKIIGGKNHARTQKI